MAIAISRSTGATIFVPLFLSMLARAFAELRQFDQTRRCIGEAMALAQASGERWFDAEICRIAGEIELGSSERKGPIAQRYFEQALGVARAQQARSWELRAATSLARLWRGQGRRTEARDLLARVYDWFTEGFDTLDLKRGQGIARGAGVTGCSLTFARGTDRAGNQPLGLFLKVAASRFPMRHATIP